MTTGSSNTTTARRDAGKQGEKAEEKDHSKLILFLEILEYLFGMVFSKRLFSQRNDAQAVAKSAPQFLHAFR